VEAAYGKTREWLGGVVYEDPWLAGGHNGLSNSEDPKVPEDPYPRVLKLRQQMREFGLGEVPIIMAGGVWWLEEWEDWIDNPELGPVAFQFGTRPLLTRESPISDAWKQRLLTLRPATCSLQPFSPTGFYSIGRPRNEFLRELETATSARSPTPPSRRRPPRRVRRRPPQAALVLAHADRPGAPLEVGASPRPCARPDNTLIFVTPEKPGDPRTSGLHGLHHHLPLQNWAQVEARLVYRARRPIPLLLIPEDLMDIAMNGSLEDRN
jgi:NAD(P)H-dependent flavin oxidoreductase YrpB (nitropropane dioxygenase family)